MTTYIALFNLTDAGIKAATDSPRRLDAEKKLLADMGGKMKQFYMVMGDCDFLGICEARPWLRAHEDLEGSQRPLTREIIHSLG
jgi:uncharacterized protein with GYD domain